MQKIISISLILLFLFTSLIPIGVIATFAELSEAKIEFIYTRPYHEKYQYSFKIYAEDKPVGPYAILVESDIDSKIINKESIVQPNTWVQWFTYAKADDPKTINVTLIPS